MKTFILRLLGHDEIVYEMKEQYQLLSDFVWNNCKMTDKQGHSDTGYNSREVCEK